MYKQQFSMICRYMLVVLAFYVSYGNGDKVVQLTSANIDSILHGNELVFVNFYADWCRFSQMLGPVFAEASDKVAEEFPDPGKVVFAKVDCDAEGSIAQNNKISKYPTLKLFRFGESMKREYRGSRSAEAFAKYISEQLVNPIIKKNSYEEMESIADGNRNMLVYVEDENSNTYKNILRAASQLRSDCKWYVVSGPAAVPYKKDGDDVVYYRAPHKQSTDIPFTGLTNVDSLTTWAKELCVPRVRVLNFENAEELTEEGIPFLILFHHPDDMETPERFKEQVNLQLSNDKDTINTLTADGLTFAHPLQHLGKSSSDLPIIAIDSFKHMYIFKHDVRTKLGEEGLLKQFVDDLNSGKLHREYHYGPDPTESPPQAKQEASKQQETNHIHREPSPSENPAADHDTSPPDSVFKKLAPSHNRYTVLQKDEL